MKKFSAREKKHAIELAEGAMKEIASWIRKRNPRLLREL